MSKRGLNYNYSPGDHVLCFEPDPKKVKVIYPAKVMEHCVRRSADSNHRQVAYRVHFQGWKASWDREVTEEMLLEDTPFNRELMFRIDEITRRTRRIEEVRDRISRVLAHVTSLRCCGRLSSPSDEEAFDWNQVDGILQPLPPQDGRSRGRATGRKASTDVFGDSEEEEEDLHVENLELHRAYTFTLQPSPLLRRVLEADEQRVTAESGWVSALTAGPGEQSVVRFLESYLQSFVLRPSRPHSSHAAGNFWAEEYARTDRSLRLAFEVCSSLRVLFDVFLPEELLFSRERAVNTGRKRTTKDADCSAYALLPPEAKDGRSLPSCIYPPIYLLRLLVILPDILESMDLSLCRKAIISRHVSRLMRYMEDTVADWFPQAVAEEEERAVEPPPTRRRNKRLSC